MLVYIIKHTLPHWWKKINLTFYSVFGCFQNCIKGLGEGSVKCLTYKKKGLSSSPTTPAFKKNLKSQACWLTFVTPALRRQRQLANLAYTASPRWETLPQKNRWERPEEQHWADHLMHVTLEFMCVCIQTHVFTKMSTKFYCKSEDDL